MAVTFSQERKQSNFLNKHAKMLYVFIVDTSGSMNRTLSKGMSLLDCAKYGIEWFFKVVHWEKVRSDKQFNKYLLITYGDSPSCFKKFNGLAQKAGFSETAEELLAQLKYIEAHDLSNAGQALNAAFDYVNAYRFQSGLDTLGSGRFVGASETTVMFWFTDGTKFLTLDRGLPIISEKLNIPGLRSAGCNSYFEPFRWDQRLLTFLLGPEEMPAFNNEKSMVNSNVGQSNNVEFGALLKGFTTELYPLKDEGKTFPIPETYKPPRTGHPIISYRTKDEVYNIPHGFPFDRLPIEQSHWTCKVYVKNSGQQPGLGEPFGFLKVSTASRGGVNLYILPYNFPVLFKLLAFEDGSRQNGDQLIYPGIFVVD
ncbi:hypothetical protein BC829DRAFT_412886 [Chytridium lagenaria]|nr:hypothetical protein BC829DRAFT_412886 [Chytridium lagenaria]